MINMGKLRADENNFKEGGFIGIAQINPVVGDLEYNSKKVADYIRHAESLSLDAVVFPEFALIGTPFGGITERHPFIIAESRKWLNGLAKITGKTAAIVGFAENEGISAAAILRNGRVEKIIKKSDKDRIYTLNGIRYGISFGAEKADFADSDVIINCSAIPFGIDKVAQTAANECKKPVICANQVGAVDNISFSGGSVAVNCDGKIFARAKFFEEDFVVLNPKTGYGRAEKSFEKKEIKEFTLDYDEADLERIYKTIVQGTKDYFKKCGLKRAVLGLSGGLDSTVCAVILTDVLGKDNVFGVSMPSKLTSDLSKSDAKKLADNLGIGFAEASIKPMFDTTSECFGELFKSVEKRWNDRYEKSFTPDNIQARSRATYLWGVSNEFPSCIPIATSDKSEAYMGYATINGDMSGGFAPIADVTKTQLFALARWLNKYREVKNVIPETVITRKPGAELAIDPKTGKTLNAEDALMPYEFLDEIIWRIENKGESYQDLLKAEFIYEKREKISKEQKTEWLDKFYRRMSSALYKWSIAAPAVIVEPHSINGAVYSQPITSGRINYKGSTEEEIISSLQV